MPLGGKVARGAATGAAAAATGLLCLKKVFEHQRYLHNLQKELDAGRKQQHQLQEELLEAQHLAMQQGQLAVQQHERADSLALTAQQQEQQLHHQLTLRDERIHSLQADMRSNKQQHEQQLKEQRQQLEVQWEMDVAYRSAQHKQVCEELGAGYEQQLHQLQAERQEQMDTLQQQLRCAHACVQQLQQEFATATAAHDKAARAAAALRCKLTNAQQAAHASSAKAAAATQEAAASKQQLAEAYQQLSQERAAVLAAQAATKDSSEALDAAHQRLQQVSAEVGRLQRANQELKQQLQQQEEQAAAEHAAWQASNSAWQQQQVAGLQAWSSRLLAAVESTHSAVAAAEGADAASAAAGSATCMLAGNMVDSLCRQQSAAAPAHTTTATWSPGKVNNAGSATRQRHPGAAAVVDGPMQQHKGSDQHQQQQQQESFQQAPSPSAASPMKSRSALRKTIAPSSASLNQQAPKQQQQLHEKQLQPQLSATVASAATAPASRDSAAPAPALKQFLGPAAVTAALSPAQQQRAPAATQPTGLQATDVTATTSAHTQPLAPLAALQLSSRSTNLSLRDGSNGSSLSNSPSTGSLACTLSSSGRSSSSSSSSCSVSHCSSANSCTGFDPRWSDELSTARSSVPANMPAATNWCARLQTAPDRLLNLLLDADVAYTTARKVAQGFAAPATDLQQPGAVELLLLSCMEPENLKTLMERRGSVSVAEAMGVVGAELLTAWQQRQQREQAALAAAVPAALAATAAMAQRRDAYRSSSSSSTNNRVNVVGLLNRGHVMGRDGQQRATNSCYLNSLLQLLHMSGLCKNLLQASARAPAPPPSSTAGCLLAIAAALQQRSTKQLDLAGLRMALTAQDPAHMEEGRMHDPEAALHHIVASLGAHTPVSTTAGPAGATGSGWDDVAGCVLLHKTACARCNSTGEVFAASMLHELRFAWCDANKQPLAQLLREESERTNTFQQYSELVGVCLDCGCLESLRTEVARAPPFLPVHGYSQALEAPGEIAAVTAQLGNELLQLSDWMPCSSQAGTAGNSSSSSSYSLAGVCLRRGPNRDSGRYVALLRLPHAAASQGSSTWVLLDDAQEPQEFPSWHQAWTTLIKEGSWVPTTLLYKQGGTQPRAVYQQGRQQQQQQQQAVSCWSPDVQSGVDSWVQVAGRRKGKRPT